MTDPTEAVPVVPDAERTAPAPRRADRSGARTEPVAQRARPKKPAAGSARRAPNRSGGADRDRTGDPGDADREHPATGPAGRGRTASVSARPAEDGAREVDVADLLLEVVDGPATEQLTVSTPALAPGSAARVDRLDGAGGTVALDPPLPVSPAALLDRGGDGRPVVAVPSRSEVRAARRLQARKVSRLVRHIDLWSLLKVALLFYVCLLLVGVVAGVLVWNALQRSGAVSSVEGFLEEIFLLENFHFEGRQMFRVGVLAGMVGVAVLSLLTVLAGLLFNLISDLVGGVRVSVVELETARAVRRRPPR